MDFSKKTPESTPPLVEASAALGPWQRFRLILKVVELRVRFVAIMAVTALVFANWDTIWNHVDKWRRPAALGAAASHDNEYFCPMHPSVVREVPGSCPICGMPLSLRKTGQRETLSPEATARLRISADQMARSGIRTTVVSYQTLNQRIRSVGTVTFDERRLARIASRIKGASRLESLAVNVTGQRVAAGDVLAEIYSPELYQAAQELLLAQRAASSPNRANSPLLTQTLGDAQDLVRSASDRLRLWGLPQTQIDAMVRDGKPATRVPIIAPMGGVVIKKNVVEGQYVNEGETLFELADLDHVWIQARLYEKQIGLVNVGDAVEAVVDAYPGRTFKGTVAFIDPTLDANTRTVGVRYDLENSDGSLRPGMFATVWIDAPLSRAPAVRDHLAKRPAVPDLFNLASLSVEQQRICLVTGDKLGSMGKPVAVEVAGKSLWACCANCEPALKKDPDRYLAKLSAPPGDAVLAVPVSAVVDTGERKIVFVETEPGVFEGRNVILGPLAGELFPVLDGLSPADKVASHGAFLLDAETRLNPAAGAVYFGKSQ